MKRTVFAVFSLFLVFSLAVIPVTAAGIGPAAEVIAPACSLIKTGLLGQKMTFCDTDIKQALGVSDFQSVTVKSLPDSNLGTLLYGSRRVGVGQTIKRKNVSALVFIPSSNETTEAAFSFTVKNGAETGELTARLRFLPGINYAPKTDGGSVATLSTQSGISLFAKMSASDPEGDALTFSILSYPANGTLTVLDAETGAYRYTPNDGYQGVDSFRYVVRDEYGNYSAVATANVTVGERLSTVSFADMEDSPAYNAAVTMDALGVMNGTLIGDNRYFKPDDTVSRAEFTAMALKTYGIKADSTLTKTFFDDNEKIPTGLVSYVATAQKIGVVNGSFDGENLLFRPNDAVTPCEAAMILSALLEEEPKENTALSTSAPAWAASAVSLMVEKGILDAGYEGKWQASMTRAEVAEMLYRLAKLS